MEMLIGLRAANVLCLLKTERTSHSTHIFQSQLAGATFFSKNTENTILVYLDKGLALVTNPVITTHFLVG